MQIAVSSWSFHKPLYEGKMRLWDIPAQVNQLGIRNVELQDMFLWPYGNPILWKVRRLLDRNAPAPQGRYYDPALLNRVNQSLHEHGMNLTAWNCDPELGRPGYLPDVRAYIRQGLQTAKQLAAPILRITMDHEATGSHIGPIVDTLGVLAIDAEYFGVRMALENHGHAVEVDQLLGIVQGVSSFCLGLCLDFGNFKPGCAEEDFERLAPYTIHAHAKSYEFTPSGEEKTIPYAHRINILKSIKYDGIIAIEYEGDGDPVQGIRQTKQLIEQYWKP